jgi:hypothetical protein
VDAFGKFDLVRSTIPESAQPKRDYHSPKLVVSLVGFFFLE